MTISFIPFFARHILTLISELLLILAFLVTLAYSCGWIHRLIWYLAEQELQKALNGTKVTIGGFQVDLLRGRLRASNVVLHAPKRHLWKWDSPVLCRIGQVYLEANLLLCLLSLWFLREEKNVDVYTIVVTDIQVFVERRHNVFNFFLCDPKVILPKDLTLPVFVEDEDDNDEDGGIDESESEEDEALVGPDRVNSTPSMAASAATPNAVDNIPKAMAPEAKAQILMDDMVRAIGRAAKEGSIQGALVEHRQKITNQLKALQGSKKKSDAMKEGVEIVHQMSKAVREKTQTAHQVVQPVRREMMEGETVDMIRIGRIRIRDMRIFTQDHWEGTMKTRSKSTSKKKTPASSWSKPIFIEKVDIRASELCPPLSAVDDEGLPALHRPIDGCVEVVWKRVLAEGAKSNTGRLFKTAMGEVLDYWIERKSAD